MSPNDEITIENSATPDANPKSVLIIKGNWSCDSLPESELSITSCGNVGSATDGTGFPKEKLIVNPSTQTGETKVEADFEEAPELIITGGGTSYRENGQRDFLQEIGFIQDFFIDGSHGLLVTVKIKECRDLINKIAQYITMEIKEIKDRYNVNE